MWHCPCCALQNYANSHACNACYTPRYNASNELKQLYNDAEKATRTINHEYNELIKAITKHKQKMLSSIHTLSKSMEQKITKHYNGTAANSSDTNTKHLHNTFEVSIDNKSTYKQLLYDCALYTCSLPNAPNVNIEYCYATSVSFKISSQDVDIESDELDFMSDIVENTTSYITSCKIRYAQYNQHIKDIDIDWNIRSFDALKSKSYEVSELRPATSYIVSVAIRNDCGWSEFTKPISLKTAMSAIVHEQKAYDICEDMKVGDAIDVLDRHNGWYSAQIIERDEEKGLKIHFTNWKERYDEWIDKKQHHRIAPLNEYILECVSLQSAPDRIISEPIHYVSKQDTGNKEHIIMICENVGIVSYDVQNNVYDVLCAEEWIKFEDEDVDTITTSVDTNRNIFYVIFSMDNIKSYDIEQARWINKDISTVGIEKELLACFVSDLSSYHLITHYNSYNELQMSKFYGDNMMCVDTENDALKHSGIMMPSSIKYCGALNKIIFMKDTPTHGCKSDKRSIYQWYSVKLDSNKLEALQIQMTKHTEKCYVLAFDQLLFIILSGFAPPIYCYDMQSNILYDTNKKLPTIEMGVRNQFCYGLRVRDYIHLFDPSYTHHIAFSIYDILPKELYSMYSKESRALLVFGYCKRMEKLYQNNIHQHLQLLVLSFYPQYA